MKHILGFSGGIDSQACARWLLNRYPAEDVILLNSDAGGNEHLITTEFVEWYSANVHPVVQLQATIADVKPVSGRERESPTNTRRNEFAETDPLTFDRLAYIKGRFPSRTCQFCTEHLKIRPARRWIKGNVTGDYMQYSGVRRDESKGRSKRNPVEPDEFNPGRFLNHPIIDWTKQMAFDYVRLHGEKINHLYTLGFDRVGCSPCVNSNKADILSWSQRSPESIDKVRKWEQETGLTFFAPTVPGLEINWIDDVIKWSKTVHGGKQMGLHVIYERPACESDYGLCE